MVLLPNITIKKPKEESSNRETACPQSHWVLNPMSSHLAPSVHGCEFVIKGAINFTTTNLVLKKICSQQVVRASDKLFSSLIKRFAWYRNGHSLCILCVAGSLPRTNIMKDTVYPYTRMYTYILSLKAPSDHRCCYYRDVHDDDQRSEERNQYFVYAFALCMYE
uniref:Uncharacterized protein n=1 Tax=Glossina pallidipes TaxID=7398 RepID=A0A1A9ZAL7_GLOPL